MARIALVCLILAAVVTGSSPGWTQQTLRVPSGKLVLRSVTVTEPVGGKRTPQADVGVPGGDKLDKKQLSVFADEFFMFYFGPYAQTKGYESAAVRFGKEAKVGPLTFSIGETFTYNRQESGAWEPTHDSLLDDDPIPEPTPLDLPSGKRIFVETAGAGYLPEARKVGWGTNYWSETSFETDPEAVYATSREYWNLIKDKVDPSAGVAAIYAFHQPRQGFFHFRKYLYVMVKTNDNGEWHELPPTLEEAKGEKSKLIEASFGPVGLKTVWPER